jgi:hypothetical protein
LEELTAIAAKTSNQGEKVREPKAREPKLREIALAMDAFSNGDRSMEMEMALRCLRTKDGARRADFERLSAWATDRLATRLAGPRSEDGDADLFKVIHKHKQ